MDSCFVDVTVEFLAVAFHNIMYYTSLYPKCVFEKRKKYSIVVYRCLHPDVNKYVDSCLNYVEEVLKLKTLPMVEFVVFHDSKKKSVYKFVFAFERIALYDDTVDAYLVNSEQNMRAFCLLLPTIEDKFMGCPPENFYINLHVNQSTEIELALKPHLEYFPFVEVQEDTEETHEIVPIRKFSLRNYVIDTYMEIPKSWTCSSNEKSST